MKIAVCDDNVMILTKEQNVIKNMRSEDEVRGYNNPDRLMSEISIYKPEVIFMDIDLNRNESGIDYAVKINDELPGAQIVFVSQYDEYAVDAHRADHCYYVLKDDMENRFSDVFRRIDRKLNADSRENAGTYITTLHSREKVFVKYKDILYVSTAQRHMEIHTTNGTYVSNSKIDVFLEEISGNEIIRCHQSFAVNLANIENYSREEVMLIDGSYVPISRKYIAYVRDEFVSYAERRM